MKHRLNNKISDNKIIYSFDIFDTLITRTTASPNGIFYIVQNCIKTYYKKGIISEYFVNNYARIRSEAEKYVRELKLNVNSYYDCNIDEIYENMKNNYNLTDQQIQYIKEIEFEIEYKNSLPILENINKLKSLILQGYNVILISDIYYSGDLVRKLLLKHEQIFNNLEIFTSADVRKVKWNGTLFQYVKEKYRNYKIIHQGDNKFSDYIQAKWNNLDAITYEANPLTKYESRTIQKYFNDCKINLSIGISRYLRSKCDNETYKFAVSFAAPILYNYVNWIIEQSISREIQNLYFVSRDGYILKLIADVILQKCKIDIKTHYFYSSRKSCRIIIKENFLMHINYFFNEYINKDIKLTNISNYFNISINELKKYFSEEMLKSNSKSIKQIFIENKELQECIINNNVEKNNLFIKYLKQELCLDDTICAFVDINGYGHTQHCMTELIKSEFNMKTIGFYFSVLPYLEQTENAVKLNYTCNLNMNKELLELLCRTTHGQTLGYKELNSKIVPILEYEYDTRMGDWKYEDYLLGIKDFTAIFTEYVLLNNMELQNTTDESFFETYFKYYDTLAANKLGSIPFLTSGPELNADEYAPKYNLFNLFSNNSRNKNISLKRSSLPIRIIGEILLKVFKKTNFGFISSRKKLAYLKVFNFKINISRYL